MRASSASRCSQAPNGRAKDQGSVQAELSGARKVLLAGVLWRQSGASQDWLAVRLMMRAAADISSEIKLLDRENALVKPLHQGKSLSEEAKPMKDECYPVPLWSDAVLMRALPLTATYR